MILPILLFGLLGVVFYWGLWNNDDRLPSTLIGRPIPEFALPPIEGRQDGLASANLQGQVSLVNVWASWCVPCRTENPLLVDLAEDLTGRFAPGAAYQRLESDHLTSFDIDDRLESHGEIERQRRIATSAVALDSCAMIHGVLAPRLLSSAWARSPPHGYTVNVALDDITWVAAALHRFIGS